MHSSQFPQVTVVRSDLGTLTKRFEFQPGQGIALVGKAGQLAAGTFDTVSVSTPAALAKVIERLTERHALVHGVAKDGSSSGMIVAAKAVANAVAKGQRVHTRTKECFEFPAGRAGILMLDLDFKGAPLVPTTLDEARDYLVSAAPRLANVPMLAIPSASANLTHAESSASLSLTGVRVYVWIADAADAKTIGERLHQRLLLSGAGFAFIDEAGRIHIRTLLDTSVWSPERLDFAAGAACGEGISQERTPCMWNDSAAPLALDDVPALTSAEVRRVETYEAALTTVALPESERKRALWQEKRTAAGHTTSATWNATGAVETLGPTHEIQLHDGTWVPVGEILRNPAAYDQRLCFDPIEPEYDGGRVVAKIYAHDRMIHSKAHGGANYPLRADAVDEFPVESEPAESTAAAHTDPVSRFNRQYAFVRTSGAILHTPARGKYELMKRPHFEDYTRADVVWNRANKSKPAPTSRVWLESEHRRTVSRLVFEPALSPLSDVSLDDGDPDPAFNIWPGFSVVPTAEGSCELFLSFLCDVIAAGDRKVYEWLLQWLADIVQHPATPVGTALILQGEQGVGKDTLGDVIRGMLGHALCTTLSDSEHLTGRFNSHLEGSLLVHTQEGFYAGNPKDGEKLKHLVTTDRLTIERKGVDAYEVRNCARFLITSNSDWIVKAGFGDRRFMVLRVSSEHKGDHGYFRALRQQMFENGGCARLFHYLLNEVVVDRDLIRTPLATEATRDQQIESLDAEHRWLYDILDDGAVPGDGLEGPGIAAKEALLASYQANGRDRRASKKRLTQFLAKFGVLDKRLNGARCYVFPPLAECRRAFSKKFAAPIVWSEQDAWTWSTDANVSDRPSVFSVPALQRSGLAV